MGESGLDSRQRLVDTASRLFRVQGYHATGLNQIVDESRAPKGSLYHYFPQGKEQLAEEAMQIAGDELKAKFREVMGLTPIEALDHLIECSVAELESSDYRDGCPIATVALETSTTVPGLREVCCKEIDSVLLLIENSMVAQGLPQELARSVAMTLFSAFEGALMVSMLRRSSEPLRQIAGPLKYLISQAGALASRTGQS